MTTNASETLIRSILGPIRPDVRPLAEAVDLVRKLLFTDGIPMDDIHVTKMVYPPVAKRLHMKPSSLARRIERLANRCWDTMRERDLSEQYIGEGIRDIQAPSDLLFYLAFYIQFGKPFYQIVALEPALLF